MIQRLLALVASFLALPVAVAAAAQEPRNPAVDALFARWAKPDSPGCAVAVLQDGEPVHVGAYGVRDVGTGEPIGSDTAFYIGSTSKQFTAACVALLARDGKLSLDDDVRKWVPELPDYGATITLRHLIHHRSGLRDYLELAEMAGYTTERMPDRAQALALVCAQREANFPAGYAFSYSNSGYFLLGEVVRRASGKSLRAFAQERLLAPLGMTRTVFKDDPALAIEDAAISHVRDAGGAYRRQVTNFALVGSGGLWSTVRDLAKWDAGLAAGATFGEGFAVSLEQAQGNYAFGLMIGEHRGLRTVRHGGALFGYRADLLRFPEQRFTAVCLANASDVDPGARCEEIAALYLADAFAAAESAQGAEADGEPAPAAAEPPQGKRLFRDPTTRDVVLLDVRGRGGRAQALGASLSLRARDERTFEVRGTPRPTTVVLTRDGGADGLELRIDGEPPRAYRELARTESGAADREALAGTYHSDEVGADVEIVARENGIAVRGGWLGREGVVLAALGRDHFASAALVVEVERDDGEGMARCLRLSTPRARNLAFARK